jgi:hypothetical protein
MAAAGYSVGGRHGQEGGEGNVFPAAGLLDIFQVDPQPGLALKCRVDGFGQRERLQGLARC